MGKADGRSPDVVEKLVRLPRELDAALKRRAEREDLSQAWLIRRALRQYLADEFVEAAS